MTLDFGKERCSIFKKNHDYIIKRFSEFKGFKAMPAEGTLYLTVLIDAHDDVTFVKGFLEQENVMLLPLSWSGTSKYKGFR